MTTNALPPPPRASSQKLRLYAEMCRIEANRLVCGGRNQAAAIFLEMQEHFERLAEENS